MSIPLNQRNHHAFLSHSSRDKEQFVDRLHAFLQKQAGLNVWYDRGLVSGQLSKNLDEAISDCRAAIIVLSENSANSKWVELECSRIIDEANNVPDFRIATIRLDRADAPGLLKAFKHIDALDGVFSFDAAALLMETLRGGRQQAEGAPVYISRGWRPNESKPADAICRTLRSFGLKLIADWRDQGSNDPQRVSRLMDGTRGLAAIVPHRGKGQTSDYIVKEIDMANDMGIPVLAFIEDGVDPRPSWEHADVVGYDAAVASWSADELADTFGPGIETFAGRLKKSRAGEHVFLGHSLEQTIDDRFMTVRRMLARITGLPVLTGGEVSGIDAQAEIVRLISESELSVIDITNLSHPGVPEKINFGLNSCIEAGIALGAGRELYITCQGERRSPPFMFRNKQVWYYKDEVELVGKLAQIANWHRRMVL